MALALLVSACTIEPLQQQVVPHPPTDTVTIGVLTPTSGPLASFGRDVNLGIELFLQSEAYGAAGHAIALRYGDTAGDPAQAVAEAQRLVEQEHVDLLMGLVNSAVAAPVAQFADAAQIPLVITIAGASEVTGADRSPYVFRTAMANGQQERPLAWYLATEQGAERAATLAWDFAAGAERSAAFADAFAQAGGAIVAQQQPPLDATDFRADLAALAAAEPDVVYAFVAGPEAATLVQQMRHQDGLADLLVAGTGYLTAGVLQEMGDDAPPMIQGAEYTSDIDSPVHQEVVAWLADDGSELLPSYREKVRAASDVYVMEGFLSASVVAQALESAAGEISNTASFLDALAAVEFDSVSGPFRFDAQGQAVRNLYIVQLAVDAQGILQPDVVDVIEQVSQHWQP